MANNYGAAPEEWAHFSETLGLTADLLPVVSNPKAVISTASALSSLGKVPSTYNQNKMVSGFAGWTNLHANAQDVALWARQPDYGICLQTRTVRAIDVDITEPEEARAVAEFLAPLGLPMRFRADSSKFLLVFKMEGAYPKRSFKTSGGIVEFLGTGQQFIACGTHPNGARYEWRGGLPTHIPTLSEADILDILIGVA